MYSVINNGPSPKKELSVLNKHCYCCLAAEEQLCSHIGLCLNSEGEPCSPVLPFTPLCFVTIVLDKTVRVCVQCESLSTQQSLQQVLRLSFFLKLLLIHSSHLAQGVPALSRCVIHSAAFLCS